MFRNLISILVTGVAFIYTTHAVADQFDQHAHMSEEALFSAMKERFNDKPRFNDTTLFADFRFKRDAMVVAVGCDTIPNMFYEHKTHCYKKGLTLMKDDKLKFGNLINVVCGTVHETFINSDFTTLFSYDQCMERLTKVLPSAQEGVVTVYNACHDADTGPDWIGLASCYARKVPPIEDTLEKLPKASKYTVSVGGVATAITSKPELPPRSDQDRWKLDALHAACTAMDTNDLTEEERLWARQKNIDRIKMLLVKGAEAEVRLAEARKKHWAVTNVIIDAAAATIFDDDDRNLVKAYHKIKKQLGTKTPEEFVNSHAEVEGIPMSLYDFKTYSVFRDDHCFKDGFYALAFGTTVPGTVISACMNRIPGVDYHFNPLMIKKFDDLFKTEFYQRRLSTFGNSEKFVRTYLSASNWGKYIDSNFPTFVDHKTACLEGGSRSFTDSEVVNYAEIELESRKLTFESFYNLVWGLFWDRSVYENQLKFYHDKEAAKTKPDETTSGTENGKTGTTKGGEQGVAGTHFDQADAARIYALALRYPDLNLFKEAVNKEFGDKLNVEKPQ